MMELLAPAGSYEALLAAIHNGADAVYFGLAGFNARGKAENCRGEGLEKWLKTCRRFGVKAYVAANTLIKDGELFDALEGMRLAWNAGADAFIVQDLGLAATVNALYPDMVLHLSTQAGVASSGPVKLLRSGLRFSRVILARECGAEEIENVVSAGVEVEVFVHGALCVAYSGSCYFSSMLTGNSGNRGRCQQFCRTPFTARIKGGEATSGYLLSPADLCLLERLEALKALNVASVKIEGRMKRPEYVAEAVRRYRAALDGKPVKREDLDALKAVYNRGNFTEGYFGGVETRDLMSPKVQGHRGLEIGRVTSVREGKAVVRTDRRLLPGDGFKILSHDLETGGGARPRMLREGQYELLVDGSVSPRDVVCLTTDSARNAELLRTRKTLPLTLRFSASLGERPQLTASCGNDSFTAYGADVIQPAARAPLTRETVLRQLSRLGGTDFALSDCEISLEEGGYLEISSLNELRRQALNGLVSVMEAPRARRRLATVGARSRDNSPNLADNQPEIAVIFSDLGVLHSIMSDRIQYYIYAPPSLTGDLEGAEQTYLYLPYYLRRRDAARLKTLLPRFRGVYANNPYGVALGLETGLRVFGGELNVFNADSIDFWRARGVEQLCVSKELSLTEIRAAAQRTGHTPFVPVFGDTVLMGLNHCPVQNATGCGCGECAYGEDFAYRDRRGAIFPIRKLRYFSCYFELMNNLPVNALKKPLTGVNYLLDMRSYPADEIRRVADAAATEGQVQTCGETTSGRLYRGVI